MNVFDAFLGIIRNVYKFNLQSNLSMLKVERHWFQVWQQAQQSDSLIGIGSPLENVTCGIVLGILVLFILLISYTQSEHPANNQPKREYENHCSLWLVNFLLNILSKPDKEVLHFVLKELEYKTRVSYEIRCWGQ